MSKTISTQEFIDLWNSCEWGDEVCAVVEDTSKRVRSRAHELKKNGHRIKRLKWLRSGGSVKTKTKRTQCSILFQTYRRKGAPLHSLDVKHALGLNSIHDVTYLLMMLRKSGWPLPPMVRLPERFSNQYGARDALTPLERDILTRVLLDGQDLHDASKRQYQQVRDVFERAVGVMCTVEGREYALAY